eukprot:m.237584 g.237584  ORF g.237584 m.237584 type:complete len:365 (+) comp10908_c0_seq5:810-1904(+)
MATIKDNGKGTIALAAFDKECKLKRHEIGRPDVEEKDVHVDIKFCGICHSDVHACDGTWGVNKYPMAPGHEVAGVVRAVGSKVEKFKVGDRVGVGCHVGSCRNCETCDRGLEQHCTKMLQTYSSDWPEDKGHADCVGMYTNGGYSSDIVVDEHFVFKVPDSLELEYVGPLLCAGVTTYSPLSRHLQGKENQTVGIVGFGGLGHMAAKIAKAMGARVIVMSRSDKKKDAADKLGAELLVHTDEEAMDKAARSMDLIIDTVSANHDNSKMLAALKVSGTLVQIGLPSEPMEIAAQSLIFSRVGIEGSLTAGCAETQETLDFCAKHNIRPDIRVCTAKEACERFLELKRGEGPASRNVMDSSTLKDL